MSKSFLDRLRERVEAEVAPLRKYDADDRAVRMALTILDAAAEIQAELLAERVTTKRAAELTGWCMATLERRARAQLAGVVLPAPWAELQVEDTGAGYVFVVGTIPAKAA